jgi:simple sugar transport system substrate-binding protein
MCEKTMQSMIELDGAKLRLPTSFGYFDPYMLRQAAKYPECSSATAAGCGTGPSTRSTPAATSATSAWRST